MHPNTPFLQQLSQSINQLDLLQLYKQLPDQMQKTQVISRLKLILVQIPNAVQTHPAYLKECNDAYYCLLFNQISQNLKKDKPDSLNFLYHVVSLRIKFWFVKKQFDDLFNAFMLGIEQNKTLIPSLLDFLIQLIDTFESNQFPETQNTDKHQQSSQAHSRLSLTRKTNNSLFRDELLNRKTHRATRHLTQSIQDKQCFTKQNKFQREFVDFELNKFLIFANEVFNRAVVTNPNYDPDDSAETQHQEEPIYLIKMAQPHILKTLKLIHKIMTYDFFGDRKPIESQDFTQKMPLIIPTKYSKLAHYHQFQNWIKNKKDFYRYQYLYFVTTLPDLKVYIIKIFGDLLRIHQKFFKKELLFKTHLENVLVPLKGFIENLQINLDTHSNLSQHEKPHFNFNPTLNVKEDLDLALAFGQSINKLLTNSVFPTFLHQCRPDLRKEFLESVEELIHRQILSKKLLDVSLVRSFIGFFVEIIQKLYLNSMGQQRVTDFKQQVEKTLHTVGAVYEDILYSEIDRKKLRGELGYFFGLDDAIDQLNLEYFKEFFTVFKFFTPFKPHSLAYDIRGKSINLCSKIENYVSYFEVLSRWENTSGNEQKKKQLLSRHISQCLVRLNEMFGDSELEKKGCPILNLKVKLLTASFYGQKLLFSRVHFMLNFEGTELMEKFTRSIIELVFKVKVFTCKQESSLCDDRSTVYQYAMQLLVLAVKINEKVLVEKGKSLADIEQIDEIKRRFSGNKNEYQLQLQANMKEQCQFAMREVEFFENLVRQIKQCSGQKISSQQIDGPQGQKLSLKALWLHVSDKEFQRLLEPIYKLYFIALQKLELHRKRHQQVTVYSQNERKRQNPEFHRFRSEEDEYVEQAKNDDDCSVIEEIDPLEDVALNPKTVLLCSASIEAHNLNKFMNPIAYCVFLDLANENQSLRQYLILNFANSFKEFNTNHFLSEDLDMDPKHQHRSYNSIYSIKRILSRLSSEFFTFANEQSSISLEIKQYVLQIVSNLFRLFKRSLFEDNTKIQLIQCVFHFVLSQFQDILNSNYCLEPSTDEIDEDLLMATKVQTFVGLLQTLISVHFMQEKTNIYNLEFLILFPQQQQAENILSINSNQKKEMVQIFNNTNRISRSFQTALNFILNFPQSYLENAFYPSIQTQLIALIQQVYFQFSQFITIYLFELSTEDWSENLIEKLNVHKIVEDDGYAVVQNYAIVVNNENLPSVIWAHIVLLQYIQKVMELSLHSHTRPWFEIRNKELLPFLKQITIFFNKISQEAQVLKMAFEWELVDNQNNSCLMGDVVRKLYATLFGFCRYFLGKLQNWSIGLITQHFSFIECIYEIGEVGRKIKVRELSLFIEGEIEAMNSISVFNYAPVTGSKKSGQSNRSCRQYKGWEYIEKIAVSNQIEILQQLEAYEMKFKYYIDCEPEFSETVTVKESSQTVSAARYEEIQMSVEMDRPKAKSMNKPSPIYKAETDLADVEDNEEQSDFRPQTPNRPNSLQKSPLRSQQKFQTSSKYHIQQSSVKDVQIDGCNSGNEGTDGPDSLMVNVDSGDQNQRLHNCNSSDKLDDFNEDDLDDPYFHPRSPDKHQSFNEQIELENQFKTSNQEISFQSPKQTRLVEDDELTTYDLVGQRNQKVSPIEEYYSALDPILEESHRNSKSYSQGFSRMAGHHTISDPSSDLTSAPLDQNSQNQSILGRSQPIYQNFYLNGFEYIDPYAVENMTEPLYCHNSEIYEDREIKLKENSCESRFWGQEKDGGNNSGQQNRSAEDQLQTENCHPPNH